MRQLAPSAGAQAEGAPADAGEGALAAGVVKDASEKTNHSLPPAQPVPEDLTPAHVANGCIGCHGARLTGGKIPGAPPQWLAAVRLRPGPDRALDRYPSAEPFMAMLKSGKRPDGSAVSTVMPFDSLKEPKRGRRFALYAYLRSLPES